MTDRTLFGDPGFAQRHERRRPDQQARIAFFAVSRCDSQRVLHALMLNLRIAGAVNGTSRPLVLPPVTVCTRVWNG